MSPRVKLLLLRALILRPIDHWPYKQARGVHHPLHGESFVHYIPWSILLPIFVVVAYACWHE